MLSPVQPSSHTECCYWWWYVSRAEADQLPATTATAGDIWSYSAATNQYCRRYIKTCRVDVNLFVDHSQIVQPKCLRRGIWGTKSLWGRVLTYKTDAGPQPQP